MTSERHHLSPGDDLNEPVRYKEADSHSGEILVHATRFVMNVKGLEYNLISLNLQHSSVYLLTRPQPMLYAWVGGCCDREASYGVGNTPGIPYCSTSYFTGDVCRDIFTLGEVQIISSGENSRPVQSSLAQMSAWTGTSKTKP